MNILYVGAKNPAPYRKHVVKFFSQVRFAKIPEYELPDAMAQHREWGFNIANEYIIERDNGLSKSEVINGMDTIPFLIMMENIHLVVVIAKDEAEFIRKCGAMAAYPNVFKNTALGICTLDRELVVASHVDGQSTNLLRQIQVKTGELREPVDDVPAVAGERISRWTAGGKLEIFINVDKDDIFDPNHAGVVTHECIYDARINGKLMRRGMPHSFVEKTSLDLATCLPTNPLQAWVHMRTTGRQNW
jgi:hypothetical protein